MSIATSTNDTHMALWQLETPMSWLINKQHLMILAHLPEFGVRFLPWKWKRGDSAMRMFTATFFGMYLWFRRNRSIMAVYMPSID
jgi:hypothetical protein